MKIKDISGQRFGQLVAVMPVGYNSSGNCLWLCKCDCGENDIVIGSQLRNGSRTHCRGSAHPLIKKGPKEGQHYLDISGQKFNYLTALYVLDKKDNRGSRYWHCRCECGKEIDVVGDKLRGGIIKSCGCKNSKKSKAIGSHNTISAFDDLTGKRFNHVVVLGPSNTRIGRNGRYWCCKCDCGAIFECSTTSLTHRVSCGCMRKGSKTSNPINLDIKYPKPEENIGSNTYKFAKFGVGYTSKREKFFFDLEDYDIIKNYTWYFDHCQQLIATDHTYKYGMQALAAWRLILNDFDKSHIIYYRNQNKYDLRKENLRVICT